MNVRDAAERWVNTYVATARNPKGQRLAVARANRYVLPALGPVLLSEVTGDHVRQYRLWLEE